MDRHGEAEATGRPPPAASEAIETVIIGGGQAGLEVGNHLAKHNRPFVILDANQRIGDSWRHRWDSLRLFTPARYSSLPGMAFPASAWSCPAKGQVANYLETYAARFQLPVRTSSRVERLAREGDRYIVVAGAWRFEADQVVVASGAYQRPRIPVLRRQVRPEHHPAGCRPLPEPVPADRRRRPGRGRGQHRGRDRPGSSRRPSGLAVGPRHRPGISLPGRQPAGSAAHPSLWFVISRVLTVDTRIGRKLRHKGQAMGWPLVRVKPKDVTAAGIQRVPRTVGSATAARCSRTAGPWMWPTWSGAPASPPTSTGSTSPSWVTTADRRTTGGWSRPSPGCTSSGCSSSPL